MSSQPHPRRNFLKWGSTFGLASLVTPAANRFEEKQVSAVAEPKLNVPKRLEKGNTIGLIAPASSTDENEEIRFAIDIVRSLGFEVKKGKHLFKRKNYLAGDDRERAEDVNNMFADPDVHGIIALRGGYGSPRILPYLNYAAIAKTPKVFMGYSDITAMLHAINQMSNMVTYHGPIAKQMFTPYTLAEFKKVVMFPEPETVIGEAPAFNAGEGRVQQFNRITHISPGKARGRLIGGNLTLLCRIQGTPYEPDYRGKILFVEEVSEEPYRIDSMLTSLWLAGKLQQLAGIAFGKFMGCGPHNGNSFYLEEVFRSRVEPLKIPCIRGLMVGHLDDQTVLPIGIEAELDADEGKLKLLQPAVS